MGGEGGSGAAYCCGGTGGRGRIRVDAVILKGAVSEDHGIVELRTLQEQFVVHFCIIMMCCWSKLASVTLYRFRLSWIIKLVI